MAFPSDASPKALRKRAADLRHRHDLEANDLEIQAERIEREQRQAEAKRRAEIEWSLRRRALALGLLMPNEAHQGNDVVPWGEVVELVAERAMERLEAQS